MRSLSALALFVAAALALAGCVAEEAPPEQNAQPQANVQANAAPAVDPAVAAARDRARREAGEIRFVVDLGDRELNVFRGGSVIRTHEVAVGMPEYPTPPGRWRFDRVDINPDWVPPDSEWAEDEELRDPGEEGNPMGRARLVYNRDYTIHGTDDLQSLGTDRSHGSIRVANAVALELAQLLLKAGGAWEGDGWFQAMVAEPTRMHRIDLEHPVWIEIVE